MTVRLVSCGDSYTACLTDRGILMTFGGGAQGCLGHGDYEDSPSPRIVEELLGFEVDHVFSPNLTVPASNGSTESSLVAPSGLGLGRCLSYRGCEC